MFGKRKKPKLTKVDSLIGQNSVISGDVTFTGGLHVDGVIKGNVSAEDSDTSILSLSARGTIEGRVSVPHIVLSGVVVGDVHAYEHIELASSARVEGTVYYKLIGIAMGAEVNGKLVRVSDDAAAEHSRIAQPQSTLSQTAIPAATIDSVIATEKAPRLTQTTE